MARRRIEHCSADIRICRCPRSFRWADVGRACRGHVGPGRVEDLCDGLPLAPQPRWVVSRGDRPSQMIDCWDLAKPLGGGPPLHGVRTRLGCDRAGVVTARAPPAGKQSPVLRGTPGGPRPIPFVAHRGSIRAGSPGLGRHPRRGKPVHARLPFGLEWLIDRCRAKTDKKSGIVNDRFDWCREHGSPRYIVDLLKRITRVSVETMKIVDSVPELPL